MGVENFRVVEKFSYVMNVLHQLLDDVFLLFRTGTPGHPILSKSFTIFEKQPDF